MLDIAQNVLIFSVTVAVVLVFTMCLNRFWPQEKRSIHNNIIGWQLGTVGTTYAVILGFMLYTTWTAYGQAQLNVDLEANALRNLYRLASALPEPQRSQLQQEARSYATAVLDLDWPAMEKNQLPEGSHALNQAMWKTVLSVTTATQSQSLAEDHALSELSSLTEHRRTRLLQSAYRLPAIFWAVLITGGCTTVISAALFGSRSNVLHMAQVASFTMLTTLVLLAIEDVNIPFQGWVHVSNYAFLRAQSNMGDD